MGEGAIPMKASLSRVTTGKSSGRGMPHGAVSSRRAILATTVAAGYLLALELPRTAAQTSSVTIAIDAAANRHPINPNVYGMAYASASALADLNCPVNRSGGNNTSRYNWQLNADNR